MLWSGLRGQGASLALRAAIAGGLIVAALVALGRLGFSGAGSVGLLAAIIIGGLFDIPVYHRRGSDANPPLQLGVNVGGCLIPLGIAIEQAACLSRAAWGPLAAAIGVVAAFCFALARPVAGRGILLTWALPGLFGAALALVLSPARPVGFAYVTGVLGPLLGADLLHLPALLRLAPSRAGVGGAGPLDGLIWSGLLAALLAQPGNR